MLLELNLPENGVEYKHHQDHFIVVTDESCCIASGGKLKVLGDKLKRKHEHNSGDSRVSITMIRTGSVSGATGPTTFLFACWTESQDWLH
jgi:hypothetical protein